MAYRIDPAVRVFSIDTGRLPQETFDLIEQLRERYPGFASSSSRPRPGRCSGSSTGNGPNLFCQSVEKRLLCCNVRKVQPLTRALAGLDAWVTGLRRDQWASRSDIRKVEIDHDHGAIVKLNPLAEWTEEEVWDYLRENDVPVHALYEKGYTSIGCAPCTRAGGSGRAGARRTLVVGDGRARRSAACTARSRPAASSTSCTRSSARGRTHDAAARRRSRVRAERELALAEVEAVLAPPRATTATASELDALREAIEDEGLLDDRGRGRRSSGSSSSRCRPGRIRAVYGPRRRAGAASPLPQAAARGRARSRAPQRSSEALSGSRDARSRARR